ncbi:hypothetical protein CWI39_3824p0010 [Hamiltosporidium magnivora]|uniref:Uncharacterized protein n=1 Tax=Hamiltosporidium magnivora TaxID=148818 RepID=A0A4Q9KPE6_9MICR|nr:hypothetical protein CWI39_3824p0010 [Hamiltosporidium magnivora]
MVHRIPRHSQSQFSVERANLLLRICFHYGWITITQKMVRRVTFCLYYENLVLS